MKKFPKVVQCDKRGQIVIPKDIRQELGLDEGSAFWMYSITDEGILLKCIKDPNISNSTIISNVKDKSSKLNINPDNIDRAISRYEQKQSGNLENI
ncbi:AbrB/MazE/SpoVT family DNA-binding domain-containing protein [Candidatus Woesearchaeota archaeon]|nr:AbrB/MazE/SpoVT family DNA-binding domain-containing protein [Candidatus Woesearchaeota archaeon]